MTTVFLHGFWGQPSDWTAVVNAMPLGAPVWIPDLYQPGPLAPHHTVAEWCDHFVEEIQERVGRGPVQAVGYSMGGRLLVNLLLRNPDLFARALILSANPFPLERSAWEREWREKFLKASWEELESQWNEQGVFSGSAAPSRRRGDILREMLGQSLIHWSPSQNVYQTEQLKTLSANAHWAFGSADAKYVNMAADLRSLPVQGKVSILEDSGHRLPLDSPKWVAHWAGALA